MVHRCWHWDYSLRAPNCQDVKGQSRHLVLTAFLMVLKTHDRCYLIQQLRKPRLGEVNGLREVTAWEGLSGFKSALAASHDAVSGPTVRLGASGAITLIHHHSAPWSSSPSHSVYRQLSAEGRGARVGRGAEHRLPQVCNGKSAKRSPHRKSDEAGGPEVTETRKVAFTATDGPG